MIYNLTRSFTQIAETTGTIQNASSTTTVEMSTSNTPDTGILIFPLQKVSFSKFCPLIIPKLFRGLTSIFI